MLIQTLIVLALVLICLILIDIEVFKIMDTLDFKYSPLRSDLNNSKVFRRTMILFLLVPLNIMFYLAFIILTLSVL